MHEDRLPNIAEFTVGLLLYSQAVDPPASRRSSTGGFCYVWGHCYEI